MYNTGNHLGSTAPKDFSDNAEITDRYVNDVVNETTLDRFGRSRLTIHGQQEKARRSFEQFESSAANVIANLGFFPPVDYTTGLTVDSRNFTTTYNGIVYAAQPSAVPFTTGAWDDAQWYPIQNLLYQKNLLVFDTYAEASAAAATLPDGQTVEVSDIMAVFDVSGGALVNKRPSGTPPTYTPQFFGAKGDGTTDDTFAWNNFQSTAGVKAIPAGRYLISGSVREFETSVYGNGVTSSFLTTEQRLQVGTRPTIITDKQAKVSVSNVIDDADIHPALYVASFINDNSGDNFATRSAGVHSYMEQTGGNTNQYVKSICGVAVNAAIGDNDSTGVVGYSYKLQKTGGIGDACGTGGAAWQFSDQEGLVIGGEFSCHQNVPGTYASNNATSGNNSMSLHISTNSSGAPCFAGIQLDTFGLNSGRYGFWNAINIGRSCFAHNGVGAGIPGTVGINFGNNTTQYAEKAIQFGNAKYHFHRSGQAVRTHATSFDVENGSGGTTGIRLSNPSSQDNYISGYLGSLGADGDTSLVTNGSLVFQADRYTSLRAHNASGSVVSALLLSPSSNSLLPGGTSGEMALGSSGRRFSQVYAVNGTINTSDERAKEQINEIPDTALDAWGDVGFCQYKFRDAVSKKGNDARYHTGVIAQRVIETFARHGLNAADYGLLCFDSWDAVPDYISIDRVLVQHATYEQVKVSDPVYDENGNEIKGAVFEDGKELTPDVYEEIETVSRGISAGEMFGIRYEEALCFEAAYQRRENARLLARLAAIEAHLGLS